VQQSNQRLTDRITKLEAASEPRSRRGAQGRGSQ